MEYAQGCPDCAKMTGVCARHSSVTVTLRGSETPLPYACPVCVGRGKVPYGFYDFCGSAGNLYGVERCRSCEGSGVVWR